MSEIADKVRNSLAQHLGVDIVEARDEAHLMDDLGADSLDTVEIVMMIEEEFGIEIPDDVADGQMQTVGDVIRLVSKISGGH